MSNRTDWPELVIDIMDIYDLCDAWPDAITMPLKERLEREFHNAFVAGQEQSARASECEYMGIDEELSHLRAFKQEWDSNDGNSPGYNLQKARNYGKQAAIFKDLYLVWRRASMTLKSLTSISIHGVGNKSFAAARKMEKERVNEWPEIFSEEIVRDPVNRMDAIEEANRRAREELKPGPTPFHDKYRGARIDDLTTEQLEEEVARRKGEGPFQRMFVMVRVIGTLSNGVKKDFLHWEYDDIDPETFTAQHNADFLDLKVKRAKK